MGKIFDKVYAEVKKIPRGQTTTYGEIAKRVGTTSKIVGFALHRNPDPKNIPCHRVVFKDGGLSLGYVFGGIGKQKELLEKEGVSFNPEGKVIDRVEPCQKRTTFSQGNSSRPK